MASIVFNVALGRVASYAALPAANDTITVVPLLAAGLATDATLRDCATLAAVLATSSEATALGRKTAANVTVTVDNTNDRTAVDCDDLVWSATTGGAIGALLFCYVPDSTAQSDATTIPLVKVDCAMTPDGSTFTAQIADFYRATSAA